MPYLKQLFQSFEMHLWKIWKYAIKLWKLHGKLLKAVVLVVWVKGSLRSIRIESSVNKIDIFSFLRQDLTACLFFFLYPDFFWFTKIVFEWKKDELSKNNKLKSSRNLMKGISNVTSFQPFASFKRKAVYNQIGRVKPNISTIWCVYLQVYWQINYSYLN